MLSSEHLITKQNQASQLSLVISLMQITSVRLEPLRSRVATITNGWLMPSFAGHVATWTPRRSWLVHSLRGLGFFDGVAAACSLPMAYKAADQRTKGACGLCFQHKHTRQQLSRDPKLAK
jgi:hypothetical protein